MWRFIATAIVESSGISFKTMLQDDFNVSLPLPISSSVSWMGNERLRRSGRPEGYNSERTHQPRRR
jgi:hypothetical protein